MNAIKRTQTDDYPDLFDRRSVRIGLFIVVPAVVFILVSAGIRVSQFGIDHTIIVLGQPAWRAGEKSALRLTLVTDSGQYFLPTLLTGHLVRGGEKHLLFGGPVAAKGFALGRNFVVPAIAPGNYQLELDIHFDERQRTVRTPIQVVEGEQADGAVIPADTSFDQLVFALETEQVVIQAIAEDRGMPTGLKSVLFLRTLNRQGYPVSANLELSFPSGPGSPARVETVQSDRHGLVAFVVEPRELAFPIEVKNTKDHSGSHLYPHIVYGGLSVSVHAPLVRARDTVSLTASQLSNGGPLYMDVFQDGRWVLAESAWFRGGQARLEFRPPGSGLFRLQFSTSAIMPGDAVAVRHIFVLNEGEDLSQGLGKLLKLLGEDSSHAVWSNAVAAKPLERGVGYRRQQTAAFALASLYKGHSQIPTLISSRREDDAELAAFKGRFQRGVMVVIILLGLGVAALIASVALEAHRRQTRISLMILADGNGDSENDTRVVRVPGMRRRLIFQGVVLVLIVGGAFTAIALLVDTLSW